MDAAASAAFKHLRLQVVLLVVVARRLSIHLLASFVLSGESGVQ
jgi:hypothetical protein